MKGRISASELEGIAAYQLASYMLRTPKIGQLGNSTTRLF
jgi:hypothetical protein